MRFIPMCVLGQQRRFFGDTTYHRPWSYDFWSQWQRNASGTTYQQGTFAGQQSHDPARAGNIYGVFLYFEGIFE